MYNGEKNLEILINQLTCLVHFCIELPFFLGGRRREINMVSNTLENYFALLIIRRAARRRDTVIAGGIFLISFVSMIALGMLDRLTGRSMVLVTAIVVAFGFSYLTTWVKLEIIKGSIDLIDNLLLMNGG